jgi:hypothetical protein
MVNCKENEYIIYIIVDNIDIWNVKEGDAIIIYRTCNNIIND